MEHPKGNIDWNHQLSVNGDMFDKLPLFMHLENESLFFAGKALYEKELYVFLERVLNEVSFDELATELGLSYKGVAAIYYRTIHEIKKLWKRWTNEF